MPADDHPARPATAFVIDHLVQRGGAERTLLAMAAAAPEAPVVTAFHEPDRCYPEVNALPIKVLPIGRSRVFAGRHRLSAPLLPLAFSAALVDADVVFCATSGWAQGVRTTGRKIVYFQSLARWIHDPDDYLRATGRAGRLAARAMRPALARWDRATVLGADRFVTQSTSMRDAIRVAYGVDAEVLPLPNCLGTTPQTPVDGLEPGFVLYAGRLMPYKHVDLVVEIARRLPDRRFVLAGGGPLHAQLAAAAPTNVVFLGDTTDDRLRWLYANAATLLTMANEPFGVTPVEAAAFGTPTVARRAGGFLDTVVDGVTGRLVDPDPDLAAAAVRDACAGRYDQREVLATAARHDAGAFTASVAALLADEAARGRS